MYLSVTTRPDITDITYAVSFLSRYLDKPNEQLWTAGKRILRYLKGTKHEGLIFTKIKKNEVPRLQCFSDADWASDKVDRKSVSGCTILLGGNLISWFSKKQNCIAISTAEAEYVAAAMCAQDLINLKGILEDMHMDSTSVLFCDNIGSLQMIKSNENSKRAKHIDIKFHFIKDQVTKGTFTIDHVSSQNNLADLMTKSVSGELLNKFKSLLNINN